MCIRSVPLEGLKERDGRPNRMQWRSIHIQSGETKCGAGIGAAALTGVITGKKTHKGVQSTRGANSCLTKARRAALSLAHASVRPRAYPSSSGRSSGAVRVLCWEQRRR